MSAAGPTRVGDLLGTLLEKKGLGVQLQRVGALEVWADAVGESIAEVTEAKTVAASTLFVEVRSSAC